ncbi:hypothetical protein RUMCAL_03182 [Ruminococcus callidus ATCC 27760]|uniref:Uncharacterized protein n=1 Tax=Ruminococcus callidus ATCC 27760 TaxID=411473 RepID=U2K761_9FIRM|nr:hypothetical protein RUMCAL_03182 [Ruminococcus callidus ATCC 27760]
MPLILFAMWFHLLQKGMKKAPAVASALCVFNILGSSAIL